MEISKPTSCSLLGTADLNAKEVSATVDPSDYLSNEKSFLYLSTKSRPDICVAVSLLGTHAENPKGPHLKAAKRELRYRRLRMKHCCDYLQEIAISWMCMLMKIRESPGCET